MGWTTLESGLCAYMYVTHARVYPEDKTITCNATFLQQFIILVVLGAFCEFAQFNNVEHYESCVVNIGSYS